MSNSLTVGYTTNDESRGDIGKLFPFVDILDGAGVAYTSIGSEPFTPNNELRYNTFQLQDSFTKYSNRHTLTFGGSLEKYNSENVFFPGKQSAYVYNSLNDFYYGPERLPGQPEPHDVSRDAAPLPGPVHEHPRAGEAGSTAERLVRRWLRAGRVAAEVERDADGRSSQWMFPSSATRDMTIPTWTR